MKIKLVPIKTIKHKGVDITIQKREMDGVLIDYGYEISYYHISGVGQRSINQAKRDAKGAIDRAKTS
jgi:hypothetical protein